MPHVRIALAFFVLGVLAYAWLAPNTTGLPPVTVTTLKSGDLDLSTLKGKPTVINFWATTCVTCLEEMPHLVELHHEYSERGLQVVAVAMFYDPPVQVDALAKQRELPYTVALDLQGEAARAFGDVQLTPTTFLIDPEGRIAMKKLGLIDFAALRQNIETML